MSSSSAQVVELDRFVATDDELVALAAHHRKPWPSGLPTVEPDETSVGLAILRGRRSLLVHKLLDEEGRPTGLAACWAEAIFRAVGHVGVYLGDAAYQRVSWLGATSHYNTPQGVLLEATTPLGVHRFGVGSRADHAAYLREIITAAVERGPIRSSDSNISRSVCLLSEGAGGALLVTAAKGFLALAPVRVSQDGVEVLAPPDPVEPGTAVDNLLGTAGLDA